MTNQVRVFALFGLVLLCQCASQHQPLAFEPYFPTGPDWGTLPRILDEIRQLEVKSDATPWEKRRLVRLYQYELRNLDPRSGRYEAVRKRIERLKPEVRSLQKETLGLELERMRAGRVKSVSGFQPPKAWEQAFDEIKGLWNDDENEKALRLLEKLLINRKKMRGVRKSERIRMHYVRFRLAMDLKDRRRELGALKNLERLSRCSTYTVEAAFRLTLIEWAEKIETKSRWESICHKKLTESQREYWEARILGGERGREKFEKLSQKRLPHYYRYQAAFRLGKKILPFPTPSRDYLTESWELSNSGHQLLLKAEAALAGGARKDALTYLRFVKDKLTPSYDRLFAMLYTASLFKAGGSYLEAFGIYYQVGSFLNREEVDDAAWYRYQFVQDLFPRPFSSRVRWLSRLWKVDPDFVYSIMRQESSFYPQAISVAKAKGLMQLMPFMGEAISDQLSYGGFYKERYLLQAEENLKLSIFHLNQLKAKAPHPILVAAAYNAGIVRVNRWWRRWGHLPLDVFIELIPNSQTRYYAKYAFRNLLTYRMFRTNRAVGVELIPEKLPPAPVRS